MKTKGFLALADGTIFTGVSCGALCDTPGEAVFNTGMTGYQEIVSDPSYFGQIVTLSTAEVGNYGCNPDDMESQGVFLNGLIVQNLNPPSSWRATQSLDDLLKAHGKPILSNVDTRRLVLHIREHGTQRAWLHADDTDLSYEEAVDKARTWPGLDGIDCAAQVTAESPYIWNTNGDKKVVVIDCGVKFNILSQLAECGFKVQVVKAGTNAVDILAL
ncbi:MAG: carbamoyl-phosphate synthase small subunit, partial [Victivallales bacterium]|nr:carbamoyl-phosphate synthase small subunit [Victivallales bacterium]